jgi:hypothetical protein
MSIDLIRGIASHLTAMVVVIGGTAALVWMTGTGTVEPAVGVPAIVGIVAGGAGFLFGAEISKQASNQTRSDLMAEPEKKS